MEDDLCEFCLSEKINCVMNPPGKTAGCMMYKPKLLNTREIAEYISQKTKREVTMDQVRLWMNPMRGYITQHGYVVLRAGKHENGRLWSKKGWVDGFIEEIKNGM